MQLSSAAKRSDNPRDYSSDYPSDYSNDYRLTPVVLQLINARAQRKRIGMGILVVLLLFCAYVAVSYTHLTLPTILLV